MRPALASLAVIPLALAACVTPAPNASASDSPTAKTAVPQAQGQAAGKSSASSGAWIERSGVFAPADFGAVSLWPEAYKGELLVLEVVEHGTRVERGQVLAKLDLSAIEEQLRDAELELQSTQVRHEGLVQKNAIADEAAAAELQKARDRLERTRRSLEGYLERELEFAQRQKALQATREQGYVDDQVDELDQLEKMYEADELVDATEDIVLKRSRRDLAAARASTQLSAERRTYDDELTTPLQVEARREELSSQEMALAHLERKQAVDVRERADATSRSLVALEKKREQLGELQRDLELLALRAPRAGVLLHGKLEDYGPGGKPTRWERGSRLGTRSDVMLVADPAQAAVALDVPEKDLGRIAPGARVKVTPLALPDVHVTGRIEIESYPAQRGGVFDARVALDSAPAVVFGMGAKVEVEAAPEPEK